MPGNREGGLKAAKTNLKREPGFYSRIGRIGGSAPTTKLKGFAADPKLAKEVGRRIGLRTRRGYKWLGDVDSWHGKYINKATGEEEILKYSRETK